MCLNRVQRLLLNQFQVVRQCDNQVLQSYLSSKLPSKVFHPFQVCAGEADDEARQVSCQEGVGRRGGVY